MDIPFNLNWTVKVKLSDRGYARLAELHNSYEGMIPHWETTTAAAVKSTADKDGYVQMQMHEVMYAFGSCDRGLLHDFMEMDVFLVLPAESRMYRHGEHHHFNGFVGVGKGSPIGYGEFEIRQAADPIVIFDESRTITEPHFPEVIKRMIEFTRRWGMGPRRLGGLDVDNKET